MEMNRVCLVFLVTLNVWCASYQIAQARHLVHSNGDVVEDASRLRVQSHEVDMVLDGGKVAAIVGAFTKSIKSRSAVVSLPRSESSTAYEQLDEIDRLKLSINKIICDTLDEGCDHMDDMQDSPVQHAHSVEVFANLKPDEYVRDPDE